MRNREERSREKVYKSDSRNQNNDSYRQREPYHQYSKRQHRGRIDRNRLPIRRTNNHSRPTQKSKQKQNLSASYQQNRSEVCPFLVRIYYSINNFNQYKTKEDLPKDRQLILYLWMSSTLKQITQLVRAHLPSIRTKQKFIYNRIYESNHGLAKQQMGTVFVHKRSSLIKQSDQQLYQLKFNIGDFIDISINYQ